jgi:hypothetical protein
MYRSTRRIRSIEKSNDLIGNRTRDRLACSIVPQPTTLPGAPQIYYMDTLSYRSVQQSWSYGRTVREHTSVRTVKLTTSTEA